MKLIDKEAKHIMIDLETMGLVADSIVLSIGAVEFNFDSVLNNKFYIDGISMSDQVRVGRKIYPDTLRW